MSKAINLSKVYTNHSIRATGASILSKCMYGPSQVMSVTGHKSVQCLGVYQRVSDAEKIQMGESISENLAPTSSLPGFKMLVIQLYVYSNCYLTNVKKETTEPKKKCVGANVL